MSLAGSQTGKGIKMNDSSDFTNVTNNTQQKGNIIQNSNIQRIQYTHLTAAFAIRTLRYPTTSTTPAFVARGAGGCAGNTHCSRLLTVCAYWQRNGATSTILTREAWKQVLNIATPQSNADKPAAVIIIATNILYTTDTANYRMKKLKLHDIIERSWFQTRQVQEDANRNLGLIKPRDERIEGSALLADQRIVQYDSEGSRKSNAWNSYIHGHCWVAISEITAGLGEREKNETRVLLIGELGTHLNNYTWNNYLANYETAN